MTRPIADLLREPEGKTLEEVGMRLRLTIYLASAHKITSIDTRVRSGAQSGAQSDAIVQALSDGPLSASELMMALGLESKTGAFKRAIKELLGRAHRAARRLEGAQDDRAGTAQHGRGGIGASGDRG